MKTKWNDVMKITSDQLTCFCQVPTTIYPKYRERFTPKKIIRNGKATIVFWIDGTKTVVKCSDDDDNFYDAFTAALAKYIFGSNSAVKKIVNKTYIQSY